MVQRRKRATRKRQDGGFLSFLKKAWDAGQEFKPATKLTTALDAVGVNTDPSKAESTLGKIGTSLLSGARALGFGKNGGMMGQYGVSSGRGRGRRRGRGVIKT